MPADIITIIIYLTIFGLLHSFLASLWLKVRLVRVLKEKIAFYRLFYNLFSLFLLILLLFLIPDNNHIVYKIKQPFLYLMLIPFLTGVAGIFFSSKYFSLSEFLGLSQLKRYYTKSYLLNDLDEKLTLRIEGPYKYSRHPIYFFSILILISIPEMTTSRLVIVLCFIVYFFIGSIYEEKKLVKIFGSRYLEYQKNVPRIFPNIFKLL
jgi:protein-S-isoprenylcysteine O-methyltransferase Ste14